MTDPRISFGPDVVGADGDAVVEALDNVRPVVRVAADLGPAAANAAAALGVMLARVFPHTVIDGDATLGRNPWSSTTVTGAMAASQSAVPAPTIEPTIDVVISVGGDAPSDLYVGGDDWTAAVAITPTPIAAHSSGLGVHAAACFAAAEVSKRVLGPLGMHAIALPAEFVWNLLDHQLTTAPKTDARRRAKARVAAFGCGSVGSSALAVLVCIDPLTGEIWPVDPDTIDPSRNPYRYPALTGRESGPKSDWAAGMMTAAGWVARPTRGDVAEWAAAQPSPGLHGIALSSVDTVEGRRDVADVLAHTTVSAGVAGLALHVQVEHPTDDLACPYCEFADVRSALEESQMRAELTGLTEQRVIELSLGGLLTGADVDTAVSARRVDPCRAHEFVGRRLDDLVRHAYAEAIVPTGDVAKPASISAPHVSWLAGVLLAAEVDKNAQGIPLLHRRGEIDLSGVPLGVTTVRDRNDTGRCTCTDGTRRSWARRLYG